MCDRHRACHAARCRQIAHVGKVEHFCRLCLTCSPAFFDILYGFCRWERLVAGDIATSKLQGKEFEELPCRVAATVPRGKGDGLFDPDGLPHAPASRTAPFVQMALVAAAEALLDASSCEGAAHKSIADIFGVGMDLKCAVCVGSGIGALSDIVSSGKMVDSGQHRKVSPFFVPKVLLNMAGPVQK